MSRFDCYGGNYCNECEYYGKSKRYPAIRNRCFHPDNISRTNWMGNVYMRNPDDRNSNHKCEDYKPKETP
jgi:hypothetical protein